LSIYQTFSGILVIVTLLSLSQALSRTASPRERWFAGGATLLLILGLLFSLTRGAWVGFGTGVILLLILQQRARWLWVLPVVIALLFLAGPRELRVRLQHTILFNKEASGERVLIWKAGLQMAKEFPVLGVGTDMVKPLYPDYRLPGAKQPTVGHLHNSPLQVTVERGTLGLAAWIWIWVSFFVLGIKILKNLPKGPGYEMVVASLAAVTAFLTAGLFEYNFGDSEVVMLIYFVMALPFIAQRPMPARPGLGTPLS
jgi:O-antigen ligase